jgi:tRNA-splicing ligase RtcB (3'-phosphate/5'-hydroxy nucleic acid ligase)
VAISTMKGAVVDVWLWADVKEVESKALDQLRNIAALPRAYHHVAVMPDVHFGKGATVGSVIAMKAAVAPSAVGVDIGCGMAAIETDLDARLLPDNLRKLRLDVEATIPVGFHEHKEPIWHRWEHTKRAGEKLLEAFGALTPEVQDLAGKMQRQMGTLGSGNHFIELCLDTNNKVWLMLHSGSRNIGKELAEIHIEKAQALQHNESLPDRDLAYFLAGTPEMEAYRRDLYWAQDYARVNREIMLALYMETLKRHLPKFNLLREVHCHHNYVMEEVHFGEQVFVTRKGAISAKQGELGIIPGSMGAKSFIVSGLGNPDSYQSASHGAGRKMGRNAAIKRFTVRDLEAQTQGVECRKDKGVVDEIPGSYKNIDRVMANQQDLVKIEAQLKGVLCVKGGKDDEGGRRSRAERKEEGLPVGADPDEAEYDRRRDRKIIRNIKRGS